MAQIPYKTLNRTILELKHGSSPFGQTFYTTLNRTILELKQEKNQQ